MTAKRPRPSTEVPSDQGSHDGLDEEPPHNIPRRGSTISLVASDGGTFKVEACCLWGVRWVSVHWIGTLVVGMRLMSSDVMRDAWACTHPTPTVITFDDDEIEHTDILRLFSSYVKGQQVELPTTRNQLYNFEALLKFTDKWGCPSVQRHVLSDLHRSLLLGKCGKSRVLFQLAAKYDDVEFAKTIISRPHQIYKAVPNWSDLQKEVVVWDALDFRIWEIDQLADVPPEHRWALDRATLTIDWKAKDNDWKQVAKRFEQYLQIAQKK